MAPKRKQKPPEVSDDDDNIPSEVEDFEHISDIDETEEVVDDGVDDEENDAVEISEWDGDIDCMAEDKKVQMHVSRRTKSEGKGKSYRVFQGSPLRSEPDSDID